MVIFKVSNFKNYKYMNFFSICRGDKYIVSPSSAEVDRREPGKRWEIQVFFESSDIPTNLPSANATGDNLPILGPLPTQQQ